MRDLDTDGHRVLVCAPFGRDAASMKELLTGHGYTVEVCPDLNAVTAALDDDAGLVLLTEESVVGPLDQLRSWVEIESTWSNLPFLMLARPETGRLPLANSSRLRLADFITNLVILERPLGAASLISAVSSAMRGRRKQFELRNRLEELATSQAALQRTEAALRRSAEVLELKVAERTRALEDEVSFRAQAEAALRQSQKMEAVGQLTGGIAHDFNNMLTGVIGSLDLIKRRISSGRLEELDRYLDVASSSAQRAAVLTQRLLAFSRRQSLDSKPLDINHLIASLDDMLARTIGEQIQLELVLADHLPDGVADANQLESAVLNLVINARDAMPGGGRLTIETSYVELDAAYVSSRAEMTAGRYVVVAVSDTGVGMDAEVAEKAFDPFFTTKPLGQGTGLGLSMVYGFARQNGGAVRIHSSPGEGTSVKIYLPAAEGKAVQAATQEQGPAPQGLGETVLIVEDDPSVRLLVQGVLAEIGYEAVVAAEALAAIPILSSNRRLDLLVSDVGLPGMSGRELAEVARSYRPNLPILFITGYAENAAIRSGFLGTNMEMITKPFALDLLATKIGAMLEAQTPSS